MAISQSRVGEYDWRKKKY